MSPTEFKRARIASYRARLNSSARTHGITTPKAPYNPRTQTRVPMCTLQTSHLLSEAALLLADKVLCLLLDRGMSEHSPREEQAQDLVPQVPRFTGLCRERGPQSFARAWQPAMRCQGGASWYSPRSPDEPRSLLWQCPSLSGHCACSSSCGPPRPGCHPRALLRVERAWTLVGSGTLKCGDGLKDRRVRAGRTS